MKRLCHCVSGISVVRMVVLVSLSLSAACRGAGASSADDAKGKASLIVHAAETSKYAVPRFITGKFCEHLYFNVTNGMEAQILKNPTFSDYPFSTGQTTPDGLATFHYDREQIARAIRGDADRWGWPQSDVENMVNSRNEALACWWAKVGPVETSPDTRAYGGRAQRVAVREPGQGIMQWTWLPLHRVRAYEVTLWVRSPNIDALTVSLLGPDGKTCAKATASPVTAEWRKLGASLEVPVGLPDDKAYKFSVTADKPGQFVIDTILLYPADHIDRADPDVVRLLKESRLPILRWPGGNFVSTYHWRDGVGSVEERPTLPNYAWGQQENNFFGTDEFVAFCRAVGCEPMICVNAGSGTPQEAAQWIEYCNGGAETPMGKLRAANGYSQPYNVKHWEVGNELWGQWQYHWTTADGYVDRYRRFVKAMLAADSTISLYACGAPVMWGKGWNDTLIAGAADLMKATTDHPLIGGNVSPSTDPLDVFRDFMAVPEVLEQKWAALRGDMEAGGIKDPRLAVTELQMFAHIGQGTPSGAPQRLTQDKLVNPSTQAEGLYDVLIYHAAVRLAPFVEMVTHSATVNHGGGLRKTRERVFANPCYYAQSMFATFAESVPVRAELSCPTGKAPLVLSDLRNVTKDWAYRTLDTLAARASNGDLLLSIVQKGTEPIQLDVALKDFEPAEQAQVQTLAADVPWAQNTLASPKAIVPATNAVQLTGVELSLKLPPYSYTLVRICHRATR